MEWGSGASQCQSTRRNKASCLTRCLGGSKWNFCPECDRQLCISWVPVIRHDGWKDNLSRVWVCKPWLGWHVTTDMLAASLDSFSGHTFPFTFGCEVLAWSAKVTGMLAIHIRFYILTSFGLEPPFSRTAGHKFIFLMVCHVVATYPGQSCPFTNYPWIIKIDEKREERRGKGRMRRAERVSKCTLVCFSLTICPSCLGAIQSWSVLVK